MRRRRIKREEEQEKELDVHQCRVNFRLVCNPQNKPPKVEEEDLLTQQPIHVGGRRWSWM